MVSLPWILFFTFFKFWKFQNIRNFPTLLYSYHKNTSGKSEGLIVIKCEKFQIALRRWCSRSSQGMENPGKLIKIFFYFYYHCYHHHSVLFLYLSLLLLLFYYYFLFSFIVLGWGWTRYFTYFVRGILVNAMTAAW